MPYVEHARARHIPLCVDKRIRREKTYCRSAQTNDTAVIIQWRETHDEPHCTVHTLEVCRVEELKDEMGAESLLGAAGIEVFVEETEALEEHVGHVSDFLIVVGALQ